MNNRRFNSSLPSVITGFDIDGIKREHSIQDYLEQRRVELFPAGDEILKARCPLPDHSDRTPSFVVYTDGRFHCFGCDSRGDIIDLVMALEGVEFQEACRRLGATKSKVAIRRERPKNQDESRHRARRLAEEAGSLLEKILGKFAWTEEEIMEASNYSPEAMQCGSWKLLLSELFDAESVIWIGKLDQSGYPECARNFKPMWEWIKQDVVPGWHTCPSTFRPGVYSRSGENVLEHRYLVVESDQIFGKTPETDEEKEQNREGCAALIRWMRDELGMDLAAVVDTGNKSLHGWFRLPSAAMQEELKAIAPGLRLDAGLFRPAHPVRLPGAVHEVSGRVAKLIYLKEYEA